MKKIFIVFLLCASIELTAAGRYVEKRKRLVSNLLPAMLNVYLEIYKIEGVDEDCKQSILAKISPMALFSVNQTVYQVYINKVLKEYAKSEIPDKKLLDFFKEEELKSKIEELKNC